MQLQLEDHIQIEQLILQSSQASNEIQKSVYR